MSGPIFTECARTARKRTIGVLVFLRLSENLEKFSITNCSGLLYPIRPLRKEEYLKKTENLDSARTWRLECQWRVVDSQSAAVCCCSRPLVGLFYKAVPVLADEDKIGGSPIIAGVVKLRSPDGLRAICSHNVDMIDWTYRFSSPNQQT